MPYHLSPLIDESGFAAARRELGPALTRILGYYRQDGIGSIAAMENAMQTRNATAMVLPAHTMKGESRQLGAERMAEISLYIEMTARRCIENREPLPGELAQHVRNLRPLFTESVAYLERAIAAEEGLPASSRLASVPSYAPRTPISGSAQRPVFGRRGT